MLKRMFDLICATIGLLLLLPVFIIVGFIIRKDGRPTFFRQERVGLNGKPFRIFKFRSMVVNAEKQGARITAGRDSRITGIGRVMRKTKIDELPQLINVFLNQMSLVGPRPELPDYVERWSKDDQNIILSIKPGMTDYASLIYSNEQAVLGVSKNPDKTYLEEVMPNKLALYRKYVQEKSVWLDLRIIIATILKLIGVNVSFLLPELKASSWEAREAGKQN
jgi:lipopolysaccharide/colanic/teichoic acid biosynthesis glycosyltransferase